jgi:hypothetical protein
MPKELSRRVTLFLVLPGQFVQALIFFLNLAGAGISYTIDELRIDKSDFRSNKVSLLRMMWARADKNLLLLTPPVATLEPKSTTA